MKIDIDVVFESHREAEDSPRDKNSSMHAKWADEKPKANATKAKSNRPLSRSTVMARP